MMKEKAVFAVVFIAFALLIGMSFYFDAQISQDIGKIRNDFLDKFFLGLNFISSKIIIFLFLTGLFLWQYKKRRWVLPLWFSFAASVIIGFFLKIMIKRPRPFQQGIISTFDYLKDANFSSWNFSFPSLQTMFVFAAMPIIAKNFPKLKYAWIVLASLIAFSRVYFGLHFLSDVLVGGLIGYLIGYFIVKKEHENGFWGKIYDRVLGR